MSKRDQERLLKARGRAWMEANPNACPHCFCRPSKGDSEQGTDHEAFCCTQIEPGDRVRHESGWTGRCTTVAQPTLWDNRMLGVVRDGENREAGFIECVFNRIVVT